MKLETLEIEGFRSLKHVVWTPGDLNVVIGPNGSGKSNLLSVLEMIAASANGRLPKYVQNAGGMIPLLWDGRAEKLLFRLHCTGLRTFSDPQDRIEYELHIADDPFGEFLLHEDVVGKDVDTGTERTLLHRDFFFGTFSVLDKTGHAVTGRAESDSNTTLSTISGPLSINDALSRFRTMLGSWMVYHDINVSRHSEIRQAVVTRPEKLVETDGQNLVSVLHTLYSSNRDFKRELNAAMRAAFGEDFDELVFPPAADQRIQLRVRWHSLQREQSAADLSDGTLRFLFLITVLANPEPPPLIAVDEPELGLHPSMLPIIAEFAVSASRRTQVIFTTHSPEFLNAFRDTKPTTTVTLWKEGQTELKVLTGEALDYWLQQYTLGELLSSGAAEAIE